jgi:hypothetical protein
MRKLAALVPIVFIFSLVLMILFVSHPNVLAQGTTTDYVDKDFPDAMDTAKDESKRDMNAVGHVASVNSTVYLDFVRRVFGPIPGLTTNSGDAEYLQQMQKESLIHQSDVLLAKIYSNPPASTFAFVKDVGQSLGFIPKSAYAQGIGFSGLSALLPIWKVFRNIAYLLLALFMIVIGFLIMFRKKIDPKTVVTVQNALPNIVVTLILITFSYAIVGILIDLMYVIIMVAISIIKPVSGDAITDQAMTDFTSGTFFVVFKEMTVIGNQAFAVLILPFFGLKTPDPNTTSTTLGGIFSFFSNPAQAVADAAKTTVLTAGVGLLYFFLAFAFVFAIIRIFFMLISAYIQIIMSLLVSPLQLLLGAFPGSHAVEGWLKNLIANISVFPITVLMMLIGTILVKNSTPGVKLWGPPMLNPGGNEGMAGIIAMGVLLSIPSVVGSLKEALKAKAPVSMGAGGILSVGSAAGQQFFNYYLGKRQLENQLKGMQKFQDYPKNEVPAAVR